MLNQTVQTANTWVYSRILSIILNNLKSQTVRRNQTGNFALLDSLQFEIHDSKIWSVIFCKCLVPICLTKNCLEASYGSLLSGPTFHYTNPAWRKNWQFNLFVTFSVFHEKIILGLCIAVLCPPVYASCEILPSFLWEEKRSTQFLKFFVTFKVYQLAHDSLGACKLMRGRETWIQLLIFIVLVLNTGLLSFVESQPLTLHSSRILYNRLENSWKFWEVRECSREL